MRFESEVLNEENHQGVAVVNYTDRETPYTRVIEHNATFEFALSRRPSSPESIRQTGKKAWKLTIR